MDDRRRDGTDERRGSEQRSEADVGRRRSNEELKLNLVEDLVDALEEGAVKLAIGDGEVQMRVCEEPLDLSFLVNPEAELLDGALEISNVGSGVLRIEGQGGDVHA